MANEYLLNNGWYTPYYPPGQMGAQPAYQTLPTGGTVRPNDNPANYQQGPGFKTQAAENELTYQHSLFDDPAAWTALDPTQNFGASGYGPGSPYAPYQPTPTPPPALLTPPPAPTAPPPAMLQGPGLGGEGDATGMGEPQFQNPGPGLSFADLAKFGLNPIGFIAQKAFGFGDPFASEPTPEEAAAIAQAQAIQHQQLLALNVVNKVPSQYGIDTQGLSSTGGYNEYGNFVSPEGNISATGTMADLDALTAQDPHAALALSQQRAGNWLTSIPDQKVKEIEQAVAALDAQIAAMSPAQLSIAAGQANAPSAVGNAQAAAEAGHDFGNVGISDAMGGGWSVG